MNERIIFTNKKGGVSIIIPTGDLASAFKDVPEYAEHEVINVDSLPENKVFRDAWVKQDDLVVVDLLKAKEVAHSMRRAKRDEAYIEIDGGSKYIVVSDEGKAKRVKVKEPDDKAQADIDACNTVEELEVLINDTYNQS